jgi:flagellar protein FlgJ
MRSTGRKLITIALAVAGAALAGGVGAAAPAHAGTAATVRATGGHNVRTGPSTSYDTAGRIANGAKISVVCAVLGERVAGQVRTTEWWDRLSGDRYVSHGYVVTSRAVATCPPRSTPPPAPQLPNEPNGSMTPAQFVAASAAGARRSQSEYAIPASVTIAQAILESGWGKSMLAATDRNFFGMKCFSKGTIASGCRIHTTSECRAAGDCYRTEARFRVYASVTNSFRDHGQLLATSPRYRPAFAFSDNPDRFIEEIHKAGYATDPEYSAKIKRIMKQYNLYRYDPPR